MLFRCGLLGGGDGKLMALIAGYLGFYEGLTAIFLGLLIGTIWSLCAQSHKQSLTARLTQLLAYLRHIFLTGRTTIYYEPKSGDPQETIPLAACLAAGCAIYGLWSRLQ